MISEPPSCKDSPFKPPFNRARPDISRVPSILALPKSRANGALCKTPEPVILCGFPGRRIVNVAPLLQPTFARRRLRQSLLSRRRVFGRNHQDLRLVGFRRDPAAAEFVLGGRAGLSAAGHVQDRAAAAVVFAFRPGRGGSRARPPVVSALLRRSARRGDAGPFVDLAVSPAAGEARTDRKSVV